ncbi:hypothetical protein SNE40_012117 [Patella caerulea]|uniref:Protein rolling stone-like n=1 Tax=Patella caerulea TaxID=87958 RepID=A0AAN8JPQ5_PATCE
MESRKTRCSNFVKCVSLDHKHQEDFVTFQCKKVPLLYAVYRSILAAYSIMVVVASGLKSSGPKVFIWFTYWAYYTLTLSFIVRCFTAWLYRLYWTNPNGEYYWKYTPRVLKIQFVLVNIASTVSPVISIIFWLAVYDPETGPTAVSINTHGINVALVLLDTIISRHPVKLIHFFHSVIFCVVYALFTVLYWAVGGTNHKNEPYIYKILDYSGKTDVAIMYVLLVPFVGAPLCHCLIYTIFKLRNAIHYKTCFKEDTDAVQKDHEKEMSGIV